MMNLKCRKLKKSLKPLCLTILRKCDASDFSTDDFNFNAFPHSLDEFLRSKATYIILKTFI